MCGGPNIVICNGILWCIQNIMSRFFMYVFVSRYLEWVGLVRVCWSKCNWKVNLNGLFFWFILLFYLISSFILTLPFDNPLKLFPSVYPLFTFGKELLKGNNERPLFMTLNKSAYTPAATKILLCKLNNLFVHNFCKFEMIQGHVSSHPTLSVPGLVMPFNM